LLPAAGCLLNCFQIERVSARFPSTRKISFNAGIALPVTIAARHQPFRLLFGGRLWIDDGYCLFPCIVKIYEAPKDTTDDCIFLT
jgi:hypothetical protein